MKKLIAAAALILSATVASADATWFQLSFYSPGDLMLPWARSDVYGLRLDLPYGNNDGKLVGVDLGVVGVLDEGMTGVQVTGFNIVDLASVKGLQIGVANWIDEGQAYGESDDVFAQEQIDAHKVGTLIKVSEELLDDSAFDLQSYISKEFTRRIGAKEEEAFLIGDGSKKPTGILHATAGAQVGVTAAGAAAITADELIDLYYSLKSPYRKNAIWVLNDGSIRAIRKLKDLSGQYLWQPGLRQGEPDMLLGKPLYTSAYMPNIAAGAKTILFGDLSYYWIGDRKGITFKRLNERYADFGQVGFLASKRVDAKLILPEAVKVLQQKASS